jgi:hypothetical protein
MYNALAQFLPPTGEALVEPKPNTLANWPAGAGWVHVVRKPPPIRAGKGAWYSNVDRESEAGVRAQKFAAWFEDQLEAQPASYQLLPIASPLSLWLRERPDLTALDYMTPAIWASIEAALPRAKNDPGAHGVTTMFPCTPAYSVRSKSAAEELLIARVYDFDGERVTVLWMPRLEKAQQKLVEAAEKLMEGTSELGRLDQSVLPRPPREDARFSRVERALDPDRLVPFLEGARRAIASVHDAVLVALQDYLTQLAGQALPKLEGNQALAKGVLALADSFGAALFFRTVHGEIKQVRIRAVPVARLQGSDSPAAQAGKFAIQTVGANTRNVSDSVTFPVLVAARDLDQATQFFAELDRAAEQADDKA